MLLPSPGVLPLTANVGTRDLGRYDNSDFDRGAPPWKEALWAVASAAFLRNAFPWPSACRVALLRAFGARIGKGVFVREAVYISFPWRLEIGDYAWIGEGVGILSLAPVRIESHVCISQRAYLCTGSHDHRRADFALCTAPITLRAGCWIAAAAFVAPGVEVGAGAVVSAGSVALRDVPPGALVRGNPAEAVSRDNGSTGGPA